MKHALVETKNYDNIWNGAKFMGFNKEEGSFIPEDPID